MQGVLGCLHKRLSVNVVILIGLVIQIHLNLSRLLQCAFLEVICTPHIFHSLIPVLKYYQVLYLRLFQHNGYVLRLAGYLFRFAGTFSCSTKIFFNPKGDFSMFRGGVSWNNGDFSLIGCYCCPLYGILFPQKAIFRCSAPPVPWRTVTFTQSAATSATQQRCLSPALLGCSFSWLFSWSISSL